MKMELTTYEDGTDRVFRKVGTKNSDAGESSKESKQLKDNPTGGQLSHDGLLT